MPARGDHEKRRQEVARIAADLVATGGLAAATHRRIAEAAGCSTTVVSHYFADKRDLVRATYTHVGDRVSARLEAAAATKPGRLVATLEALLPLDEQRTRDWRLLFTFLGLAATDAELSAEQRERAAAARLRIEEALVAEQSVSNARDDIDVGATARALLSAVLGMGMQAVFDPSEWPAERMRRSVLAAVDDIRAHRPTAPPRRVTRPRAPG